MKENIFWFSIWCPPAALAEFSVVYSFLMSRWLMLMLIVAGSERANENRHTEIGHRSWDKPRRVGQEGIPGSSFKSQSGDWTSRGCFHLLLTCSSDLYVYKWSECIESLTWTKVKMMIIICDCLSVVTRDPKGPNPIVVFVNGSHNALRIYWWCIFLTSP